MPRFVLTSSISINTPALLIALCGPLLDARTFHVDALVIGVDRSERIVTAAHRPIPGYMPAMTMPFRVEEKADLGGLTAGMRIEFDLDVRAEGSIARRIRKVASADPDLIRPSLATGAAIPPFELTDQHGRTVRLSDLRGKLVALQFIYTRCPVAEVCPRMAAGFAAVQRRFHPTSQSDLALVSVSLDPRYDTPAVLAEYANRWRAGEGWQFLTGAPEAVDRLAGNFGVVYWPEDGTLTHTARTVLIGRDGRVAAIVEGSAFRVDQLIELIRYHLEVAK